MLCHLCICMSFLSSCGCIDIQLAKSRHLDLVDICTIVIMLFIVKDIIVILSLQHGSIEMS